MSSQIEFYKKNFIDLSQSNVTITVTDAVASDNGSSYVDYMRNRKNTSAWLTTGSTDAANTTLEVDWSTSYSIDKVMLLEHNLEAYTIKYWNGSAWTNFSTAINESSNATSENRYTFNSVSTNKIQIVITGCQGGSDVDKKISQLIVTESLGQFAGWPTIKKPTNSTNQKITKMLSGKVNVVESIGRFEVSLTVPSLSSSADLTLIESIYFRNEGVLVSLGGFDEAQFTKTGALIGYRKKDLFLMRPTDSYTPEYFEGLYKSGIELNMKLTESVN